MNRENLEEPKKTAVLGVASTPVKKIYDISDPFAEEILNQCKTMSVREYIQEREQCIIFEENFNKFLKKGFTYKELQDATHDILIMDEKKKGKIGAKSQITFHTNMATDRKKEAQKLGISEKEAEACAFAFSFYTGFNYKEVNRGASLVCRYGNDVLKSNDREVKDALPVFYFLCLGLSKMPYYWGEVMRAIQLTKEDLKDYQIGNVISWFQFTSTTKNKKPTKDFEERNTYFYIYSLTGRFIGTFSNFPEENEVLFMPHSTFLVLNKKESGFRTLIYLRQIELGFSKYPIMWVDDEIFNKDWENKAYMENFCAMSVEQNKFFHYICKINTELAINFLKSEFGEVLKDKKEFIIVSDMVRKKNESDNENAGARLAKSVIDLGFNVPIVIFCGNAFNAKKLIEKEVGNNKNVKVTSDEFEMMTYLNLFS